MARHPSTQHTTWDQLLQVIVPPPASRRIQTALRLASFLPVERQNAIQKSFNFFVFFLVQWETFLLGRILEFNSPVEKVLWLAFSVEDFYSVRKEPNPVALRD